MKVKRLTGHQAGMVFDVTDEEGQAEIDAGTAEEFVAPGETAAAESLDAVAFASGAARSAAEDAGLGAGDFKKGKGSGEDGAYTKGDVTDIIAARE